VSLIIGDAALTGSTFVAEHSLHLELTKPLAVAPDPSWSFAFRQSQDGSPRRSLRLGHTYTIG
jgi:hypothetical protein